MARLTWTKRPIEDIYQIREYYEPISKRYAEMLTDQFLKKPLDLRLFRPKGRFQKRYGT